MNDKKVKRLYGDDVQWWDKKRRLGMKLSFTTFILTPDRLITRIGFLNIKEDEVELYRVQDMKSEFPLGQRIFGCGTISLLGADVDSPQKVLKSIKRPREVKRILDGLVTAQRDKYYVRGRDMMGASHRVEGMLDQDDDGIPDDMEE